MLTNIYKRLAQQSIISQIGSGLSKRQTFLLKGPKNAAINAARNYANKRSRAMSGVQEKKIAELHSILFQQELFRKATEEKKWYRFIFKGLMNKKSLMNLNAQALMIHIT